MIVDVVIKTKGKRTRLQLCKQHVIKAIRKRLINKEYFKETREVLVDLLNQQIKALDLKTLEKTRNKILSRLRSDDKTYLQTYYQLKEPQFCRAYTRILLNLKVNSTQRNKSYDVVIKQKLNKNLSVNTVYKTIVVKIKLLIKEYNKRINNN